MSFSGICRFTYGHESGYSSNQGCDW